MTRRAEQKLLMIGVDAGELDVIRTHLGDLPHLRSLLDHGEAHRLASPADTLTSSVWPTFATGRDPGEHGVYYPMQWDASAMQLRRVSEDWIRFEPFWYALARDGVRVTALDVPFSLPSRLDNGVEVINWGSQECLGPLQSNRSDLVRAIRRRFGHHPMGEEVPVAPTAARLRKLEADLVAGARKKAELARWMMAETDWDLFVTVFAEAHRGGHAFWPIELEGHVAPPKDALRSVYRALDDAIGHVLEGVDPGAATAIVFSVHGTGPNYTQEHFVPQIVERVNARFLGDAIAADEPAVAGRRSPMRILREAVPDQAQYLLARALPTSVRDWVVQRSFLGGIDWSRTPGFALPSNGESYVRFNVAGRESPGAFPAGSKERRRYAELLRDELLALRHGATGAPVVRDVVSAAERYPGPHGDLLPDAVILWDAQIPATELRSERLGTMRARHGTGRTGDHRPDGFALLHGRRQGLDGLAPPARVTDLARIARHILLPAGPA